MDLASHSRPPFESSTGFLLARIGSLAGRRWAAMLRSHDLTPHHHAALVGLLERGPLRQQDVGSLLAVDPRNLVPVVDGLVARGLVGREIDGADRRRRVLQLTPRGKRVAAELTAETAQLERDFLAGLSKADREALNRLLRALHDTVA